MQIWPNGMRLPPSKRATRVRFLQSAPTLESNPLEPDGVQREVVRAGSLSNCRVAGSSPAHVPMLRWPSIQATGCNPVNTGESPVLNSNGRRAAWTSTPSRKRLGVGSASRVRFPCLPPKSQIPHDVNVLQEHRVERRKSCPSFDLGFTCESPSGMGTRLQNVSLWVQILPRAPTPISSGQVSRTVPRVVNLECDGIVAER